jgi:hypothetical protein
VRVVVWLMRRHSVETTITRVPRSATILPQVHLRNPCHDCPSRNTVDNQARTLLAAPVAVQHTTLHPRTARSMDCRSRTRRSLRSALNWARSSRRTTKAVFPVKEKNTEASMLTHFL